MWLFNYYYQLVSDNSAQIGIIKQIYFYMRTCFYQQI